jgi:hypothetical protein
VATPAVSPLGVAAQASYKSLGWVFVHEEVVPLHTIASELPTSM